MAESCSVFVGNIPYEVTEEQLVNVFRQFGDIQRFRLQVDANGKGRGFGFCDFFTVEAAESAKRMNNFVSINGRQLRVDSATQPSGTNLVQPSANAPPKAPGAATSGVAPPIAASYHTTSKAGRELDDALRQLNYGEAYHILEEMRVWIKRDPDGARNLLREMPNLANALLKMNMQMAGLIYAPPAEMQFGVIPPPPPIQQQQQQPAIDQHLLNQILQLSDQEVAALQPEQQRYVRQIRDSYRR